MIDASRSAVRARTASCADAAMAASIAATSHCPAASSRRSISAAGSAVSVTAAAPPSASSSTPIGPGRAEAPAKSGNSRTRNPPADIVRTPGERRTLAAMLRTVPSGPLSSAARSAAAPGTCVTAPSTQRRSTSRTSMTSSKRFLSSWSHSQCSRREPVRLRSARPASSRSIGPCDSRGQKQGVPPIGMSEHGCASAPPRDGCENPRIFARCSRLPCGVPMRGRLNGSIRFSVG